MAGLIYDSGNYEAATDKAMALFGYDDLRAEQAAARAQRPGPARHRHLDLHRDVRPGAVAGPRRAALRRRRLGARDDPDAADRQGRGDHRHLAARPGPRDRVEPDRRRPARACRSRTSRCCTATPRSSPEGMDTYGSRSLAVGGWRWCMAAEKVIEKAKPIAAHMLECHRGRPGVHRRRVPGPRHRRASALAEFAFAVFAAHDLPDGIEPRWTPTPTFDPVNFSFPHGTHLCAVEVDTETGAAKIRSYVCVDDVGKVVNPLIVEGQVHGGIAQGIAQALFEEAVYDEAGNLSPGRSSTTCSRARPTRSASSPTAPRPRRRRTRWASRASARRARSRPRRPWSTRWSTRCATSASRTSRCRARRSGCGRRSRRGTGP